MMLKHVDIFTDGACSGNPGKGGYGVILKYNGVEKELSEGFVNTTNNRMEILAAIRGLEALKESCMVDLYTDSAYLCNAFEKHWIDNWKRNGWKTASKKEVENQDLWKALLKLTDQHHVIFHKVKGHADNDLNNRCDELARKAITELVKS